MSTDAKTERPNSEEAIMPDQYGKVYCVDCIHCEKVMITLWCHHPANRRGWDKSEALAKDCNPMGKCASFEAAETTAD